MADQVRQPVQKRSIETKNKIIRAAYQDFSDVGYFNTNTAEIAKVAGVSTGIVYGYFKNKRDIMIEVVDLYIDKVYGPIIEKFDNFDNTVSLDIVLSALLDTVTEAHLKNAKIHEAINTLIHTDPLVAKRFDDLEKNVTITLAERFKKHDYSGDDLYERVHIAMNMVQAYAHEVTFDCHDFIDNKRMHAIVMQLLLELFEK